MYQCHTNCIIWRFFLNLPGAESDGEKKVGNYEPIDYEEELDFSLRVPSRLGDPDAISQISHDQVEQTVEKPATAVQPGQFL